MAEVLNNVFKSEAGRTDLKYTDSEVFADGLSTGRGFWDLRLCFEENDFGEMDPIAGDPFSTYIDPDANTYDLNKSAAYIQDSVWTDLDKVGAMYGLEAEEAIRGLTNSTFQSALFSYLGEEDISPERYFGQYADDKVYKSWQDVYYNDFLDRQAKRVRLLDSQYKVTSIAVLY